MIKNFLTISLLMLITVSCTQFSNSKGNKDRSIYTGPYNAFFPTPPNREESPSSLGRKNDRHNYPIYGLTDTRRYVRTTAYSDAENEAGGIYKNYNAEGTHLKYGQVRSAAADWAVYPVGTLFRIKGLPYTYVVDDYGSALVGAVSIDIYHPSLSLMRKWNTRPAEIYIIKMGDWDRSAALLKGRTKHSHCRKMYKGVLKNKKKYEKLTR